MTARPGWDTVTSHDCGFASKPTSPGLAAKALRNHSCRRYLDRAAAKTRGDVIRAGVDREPKPCLHKRTTHVHGTHACYVLDRCHCRPCADAASAYEKRRTRQRAYGRQAYVDAAPVLAHVLELMAAGMGLKRIAVVAGVHNSVIGNLVYSTNGKREGGKPRPTSTRLRKVNSNKLLAVQLDLAHGARVPAIGTHRRVQALVANGWSLTKIGARLGILPSNFCTMLDRDKVTRRTAEQVAALFDQLWDVAPPNQTHRDKISVSRARNLARSRGWVPPLAWDDIDNDDQAYTAGDLKPEPADSEFKPPAVYLDEVAVERLMHGTLRAPERVTPELLEAIRRLAAAGLSDTLIGARVGRQSNSITAIRLRNDIAAGLSSTRKAPAA